MTTQIEQDTSVPNPLMKQLLEEYGQYKIDTDDIVEGTVIDIKTSSVYVNLQPYGTGVIFGREFLSAKDILKNISIGDTVKGKIVETENEDGYIELSLKEARQALIWGEAEEYLKSQNTLDLVVKEANKGGLILEWQGIAGFLPASQLKSEHYPRVEDGDKEQILKELKRLIGETLHVSIIAAHPKEGKLIFSEKGAQMEDKEEILTRYAIGDELDCEVTGVVDFGLFLKVEEGLEGLVHISEIDWSLVDDPRKMFKVGEKVKAKVIEIKDGKISLSIKALKENPWNRAAEKYKAGETVSGVVIKFNKHGALVAVEEGVAGLVHVSEFESEEKLKETLELAKTYSFKINLFDPKEQRMTLSFEGAK